MDNLVYLFEMTVNLFKRKFVLYGFELSFWDIFIWLFVAGLIIWAIKEIFS